MKKHFYISLTIIGIAIFTLIPSASAHTQKPQHGVIVSDSTHSKVHRLEEVTVNGERKLVSNNVVSSQINQATINRSIGQSLATMLERISGVSSIQTGTTVSKPVIHGMYGNRLLMIVNGARQIGQQWGDDHAPEVDKNNSNKIEVVKGAEAVRYGSEALGGIIVMEQAMLPYETDCIHGKVLTMYGDNGRRYQIVGSAEGAFPFAKDIAWRIQSTYGNSGDQRAAKYMLNNTGTREFDIAGTLGYRHKNFRTELSYSRYDLKLGVLFNAQMGNQDLLSERIALGRPVIVTPFTRTITYPFQHVIHNNVTLKMFYNNNRYGNFYWLTSYQKDDREENRIRRQNLSNIPAVSLHLQSLQNQFRWRKAYSVWQTEVGVQHGYTNHKNERGTGVVPIIPNYTENTLGVYAFQKYNKNKWSAELGARFDWQDTEAAGYDWTGTYYGGHRSFNNFTYNIGAQYKVNQHFTLTSNIGLAWRAPHVYELYSNGNELGSGRYVIGDSLLNSENSYKWVTSAVYKSKYVDVRVDAYLQWIKNYVYDRPMQKNITVISGTYPVFQYMQADAFFRGVDLDLHIRPITLLDYHFTSSMIWANEKNTGNYLPYIPSFRFDHSLAYTPQPIGKWAPWIEINHRFVAQQHRFDPNTDLINTAPPAYNLFGFEAGVNWNINHRNTLFFNIAGENIFNKEYKEYTNRARYYSHDLGRDIRITLGWKF
ncbi:TonB-dependent receptor [Prevotella bivia]|uniref:TonB-dependent receptor n=1 Tax=Prevotella bivia TaxID=28125 RepID=A0A137SRA0_9BACT|nr:TonB-dependent receptor [Prevotella bivia]KXO15030.1 TonB-dependent receptor [Prevotella bivia]